MNEPRFGGLLSSRRAILTGVGALAIILAVGAALWLVSSGVVGGGQNLGLNVFSSPLGSGSAPAPFWRTYDSPLAPGGGPASSWLTYTDTQYGVSVRYPSNWKVNTTSNLKFEGQDGFFQLGALNRDTIDKAAEQTAQHRQLPYGSKPKISAVRVQGNDARLIAPSADQPAEWKGMAALVIPYPQPVNFEGLLFKYLIISADKDHLQALGETVKFSTQ